MADKSAGTPEEEERELYNVTIISYKLSEAYIIVK